MKLELQLAFPHTSLIVGENARFDISFTNASGQPLTIPHPEQSVTWPQITVRNLETDTSTSYGPAGASGAFLTPLPDVPVTLLPKETLTMTTDLFSRIGRLTPGKYEVTVKFEWEDNQSSSQPLTLTIEPLMLGSIDLVGTHAGQSSLVYVLWSHEISSNSHLVMSGINVGGYGEATVLPSMRLAESKTMTNPSLSVSPNLNPWPGQWVAWIADDQLSALYLYHWETVVPLKTHALKMSGATLLSPILVEPVGMIDEKDARGTVGFWKPRQSNENAGHLETRILQSDGSMTVGLSIPVEEGHLRWGKASLLKNGARRFILLLQRGKKSYLEMVQLGTTTDPIPSHKKLIDWPGTMMGSGMSLNRKDILMGATVLQTDGKDGKKEYRIERWSIDHVGDFHAGSMAIIIPPEQVEFGQAMVGVSPAGKSVTLLQVEKTSIHEGKSGWLMVTPQGQCLPLPVDLAQYGHPETIYFVDDNTAVVALSHPWHGLTIKPFDQ